jgi:hypothetical protein
MDKSAVVVGSIKKQKVRRLADVTPEETFSPAELETLPFYSFGKRSACPTIAAA